AFDLDDRLARQHIDRADRRLGADRRNRGLDGVFEVRRETIVQRERIALVLDDDAGSQHRDPGEPSPELGGKWRGAAWDRSFLLGRAQFGAVAADGRQMPRSTDT